MNHAKTPIEEAGSEPVAPRPDSGRRSQAMGPPRHSFAREVQLFDLSQPLFDKAPHCPLHVPVRFTQTADHSDNGWRIEEIEMCTHTGSHVDAPLHRIAGGRSITELPLAGFVGTPTIVDLRKLGTGGRIDDQVLAHHLSGLMPDAIVLLATGWGRRRKQNRIWERNSPYLTALGADWLVRHRARAVGIDHFSIGGMGPENDDTHALLLGAGMWVVEDLNFPDEVFRISSPSRFWCLPMNWPGCSGAFCRPVLEILSDPP